MILNSYKSFLTNFFSLLSTTGIDVSLFQIDHIAYYTSSTSEYEKLITSLIKEGLIHKAESIVGERRVSLFTVNPSLECQTQKFSLIEVIEPMQGEVTNSRWEHVELVSNMTLEEILEKYPSLKWDTSRMNREEFPMLKLKLSDQIQVKFPRRGALEEHKQI